MSDINGIPESISLLFRDRTAKALSEVVKNEVSSEVEKRTGIESARLLRDELKEQYKLLAAGRGNELGAEMYWKVHAATKNALSVNQQSAEYAEVQDIFNGINMESALGDRTHAADVNVRNDMARVNESALGELVNNYPEISKAIKEAKQKFIADNAIETTNLSEDQINRNLVDNTDFQDTMRASVVKELSTRTPLSAEKLTTFAKIEYDVDGKVNFNMREQSLTDPGYADNVKFMRELLKMKDAASIRGLGEYLKRGAKKVSSTSIIEAALNREAGKTLDMSRGLDGQFFRLPAEIREANKQYEIGYLGYSEAEMRGFLGDDRYNEIMAKYKPE